MQKLHFIVFIICIYSYFIMIDKTKVGTRYLLHFSLIEYGNVCFTEHDNVTYRYS